MIRTVQWIGIAILTIVSAVVCQAQTSQPSFVIDPEKPFAYLEFDHVGPAVGLPTAASLIGLWLRFTNNSRVPMTLRCIGENPDGSANVEDEIVMETTSFTVTATKADGTAMQPMKSPKKARKPPLGNSFEVSGMCFVEPGKSILFEFPRNHVSDSWILRIRAFLKVSPPRIGNGPPLLLDFSEYEIPPKSRGLPNSQ